MSKEYVTTIQPLLCHAKKLDADDPEALYDAPKAALIEPIERTAWRLENGIVRECEWSLHSTQPYPSPGEPKLLCVWVRDRGNYQQPRSG